MDPKPRPSSGQTEAADDSPSRPRWPGFRLIKLAFMFGAGPVGQRSSPLIIVLFATGANGAPPGVACDRPGHLASRSLFQGGPPNHGTPRTDNRHQPSDPRAAAAAGILFSLLLGLAITLINVSAPSNPATAGDWLTDPARRAATAVALNLVPFAGIAFLWFIGVVRDRIGQREDRFFASVFLGSGLLFVAMLFVSAAVAGGLIADAVAGSGAPGPDILALGRQLTSLLLHVYGMRMAAVFTMSTATITLRTKVVPRWIGMLGIAVAVVLLVSVGLTVWVELLFPAWILLLSIDILRTGLRRSRAAAGTAMGPQALSMLATGCHRDSLANTARLLSHSRPLSDSLGRSGGLPGPVPRLRVPEDTDTLTRIDSSAATTPTPDGCSG